MAERRMFAKTIIDSDAFLEMPVSSQNLYFHLSMRADDDGFVNKPRSIMRVCGGSDDDMKILIAKKFIIPFDNGIIVIKHWRIHNYIRKDTYTETKYKEEKSLLAMDENGAYTQRTAEQVELVPGNDTVTGPLQVRNEHVTDTSRSRDEYVEGTSTQDRLGKDRLVKGSNKDIQRHQYGQYKNVLLSDEDLEKLKVEFSADYLERIERLSEYIASTGKHYKNHLATIRVWARRDKASAKVVHSGATEIMAMAYGDQENE